MTPTDPVAAEDRFDTMADQSGWPPAFRAALESPPLERRGWQTTLAPQMIGLFLWVAYFDEIPREVLGPAGVAWPVLGAMLAGLLCYLCLYRSPALWGLATRRPLGVLAASTFGIEGATWVPGVLLAAAAIVWLGVATRVSTELSLRGLAFLGLLDRSYLQPSRGSNPGGIFLVTSLLWCLSAALVGRYLVRVIAALMNVFAVMPALLLAVTTILALNGLRGQHAAAALAAGSSDALRAGTTAALATVQFIFAFFATSGLASADWGAVARDAKDVRSGGWIGVAVASSVVATLAILTSAGAGARPIPDGWETLTYHQALEVLVRGRMAGAMLLVFGLAALGPACYASSVLSLQLHQIRPRIGRTIWALVGTALAWLLVATGLLSRLYDVYAVVGGLVAPAVGALSADYVKCRGTWPGPRRGHNMPGLAAWLLGSLLGLAPLLGRSLGWSRLAVMEPASVFGFLLAFAAYLILAGLGMESPVDGRFHEPPPAA